MLRLKFFKGNIYVSLFLRLLLILAIYSFCRIAFYAFNLSNFPGVTPSDLLTMLWGGVKFDISALLYINSLFILSQIIPFKFRHNVTYQKVCAWLFFITNGIALAFNIGDIAYYPFTLKRTTFSMFAQFANEENKATLFFTFLADYWYITLLFIATIALLVYLYERVPKPVPSYKSNLFYYGTSVLVLPVIAGLVIAGIRGGFGPDTRPITLSNAGEFTNDPSEVNIVLNTPFAIFRTIQTQVLKKHQYFDDSNLNTIYTPVHTRDTVEKTFKTKNVVVIILESFSREYIGGFNKDLENGKYKGYAPFLDSLMNESMTFTNAYANGRKSIEGLPSVIASIPGILEPYILSNYSTNKINSLGSLLAKEGYHTSFFHGAPNGSMGFSSFIKMAGVEHYYGKTEYNNDKDFDNYWGIWDEPFLQFWAKNLGTFKQPFFSTVFTLSSHHPFRVPEKYEGKFPKGTLPVHQGIGYTDHSLRRFFQTASTMPWYKNTIFVITADHSTVAWHDEYKTTLGAYAVPILFFDPNGELKGRDDRPVQQADIMPTILSYLNYNKPYFAFGSDMLNRKDNHAVVHLTDNLYQITMDDYILKFDGKKSVALYNYRNDRMMKKNLLGSADKSLQDKMETRVKAFIQQYSAHMIDNTMTVGEEGLLATTKKY